jgi:hypothetical protein
MLIKFAFVGKLVLCAFVQGSPSYRGGGFRVGLDLGNEQLIPRHVALNDAGTTYIQQVSGAFWHCCLVAQDFQSSHASAAVL